MSGQIDPPKPLPEPIARIARVFCGCGDPVAAWQWVLEHLRYCAKGQYEHRDLSGADIIAMYLMDDLELTEHGGAIYGAWLTGDGRAALAFLESDGADWFQKAIYVDSENVHHGKLF